jgi:hypothetical protein
MTFTAQQSVSNNRIVDVRVTYGPITINVAEDIGHLRSFWGDLGRVLDSAEKPEEVSE